MRQSLLLALLAKSNNKIQLKHLVWVPLMYTLHILPRIWQHICILFRKPWFFVAVLKIAKPMFSTQKLLFSGFISHPIPLLKLHLIDSVLCESFEISQILCKRPDCCTVKKQTLLNAVVQCTQRSNTGVMGLSASMQNGLPTTDLGRQI